MRFVWSYVGTLAVFALIDLVWLGLIANAFYRAQLGSLMADAFQIWAAVIFYLVYPIGVVIFAVRPLSPDIGVLGAALLGTMFGFFGYAAYDLTNLATLRNWPIPLTFVDLAWGTALSGLSAAAGRMTLQCAAV